MTKGEAANAKSGATNERASRRSPAERTPGRRKVGAHFGWVVAAAAVGLVVVTTLA